MNKTPRANRIHIGIFGRRNAGKSSLINALTGQDLAIVSDTPGTTTDPVYKSMELHPVGPVVFIDTAGYDDEGALGALRAGKTKSVIDCTDIAVIVLDGHGMMSGQDQAWIDRLHESDVPVIIAINKWDTISEDALSSAIEQMSTFKAVTVSARTGYGIDDLRKAISDAVPDNFAEATLLGDLVSAGDLVLLVMPQDIQAPKGRLILPQVQTMRELLDRRCTVISTAADGLAKALNSLSRDPDLIITDSQCFGDVYRQKPQSSALTSFSVLMAASKGDIDAFVRGASAIDDLTGHIRVLIAEACTHVPLNEDIGAVKIPRLIKEKFGDRIEITSVRGSDFPPPAELKDYDLIIHCGACMFNRRYVLSRIAAAREAGVPITNYGVLLAKLSGILDKVSIPK